MTTQWTEGPWEFVAGNEHHGPYVYGPFGDICDLYVMSNPAALSIRNGGTSHPIWHEPDHAQANARLIASAPDLYEALRQLVEADLDYIKINNLAGAENNQVIRIAQAALAKARGEA